MSQELLALLAEPLPSKLDEPRMLTVVLVVGVNGSGKTTSIAKLAQYYRRRNRRGGAGGGRYVPCGGD